MKYRVMGTRESECVCIVVSGKIIKKMTLEQRFKGGEGVNLRLSAGREFQAEGTARTKARRQGHAWHTKD